MNTYIKYYDKTLKDILIYELSEDLSKERFVYSDKTVIANPEWHTIDYTEVDSVTRTYIVDILTEAELLLEMI